MKKLALLIGIALFVSCNETKKEELPEETIDQTSNLPAVSDEKLTLVSGTIKEVKQEKDGQTISLIDQNGTEIIAVISIPNLRDNADQYRSFQANDFITFKGEYVSDQRMVI